MSNDVVAPARVREVRDLMLLYLYEAGGDGPIKREIPFEQVKEALSLSPKEYLAGLSNLQNRRLLTWPSTLNCIGLNLEGQFDVETLGSLDKGGDAQTSIMVAELREMAKQMAKHIAAQSAAREEMEAQFKAYRSRPWWQRIAS